MRYHAYYRCAFSHVRFDIINNSINNAVGRALPNYLVRALVIALEFGLLVKPNPLTASRRPRNPTTIHFTQTSANVDGLPPTPSGTRVENRTDRF
jgi:hypothetical protein